MSVVPKISVGCPPGPGNVELAKVAQDLGYDRFWLYDSAALYQDVWVWLALVGEHTDIKLGTAVLVPNLRHVMATAAAIATIEGIAPGRLACGFGTGATARWVLGKPALSWDRTRQYVEQLRGLLRGDTVDVDGARVEMIQTEEFAPARPVDVPLLLSAFGPKGQEIAREVADGVIAIGGVDGMDWCVQMVNGTVLEPGEDLTTARVKEAAGPWYVVMYHGAWQAAPEAVDGLPLGKEWRLGIETERPEGERHLAVHEGHVVRVLERDRDVLDAAGEMLPGFGWIGDRGEVRAKAEAVAASGVTEILYTPAGPDKARELRAFAEAVLG